MKEDTERKLKKADPASPALFLTGHAAIAVKAGTAFRGLSFETDTPLPLVSGGFAPGGDYVVVIDDERSVSIERLSDAVIADTVLGGFHFAPGGNASARGGGDMTPAINPYSLWDVNFRPACADPRGMALVEKPGGRFWCDIYLLGTDHLANGTSRLGATIVDGDDCPDNPAGGRFKKCGYAAAAAVMAHHGKGLLGVEEFFAAAYGVTEKTAHAGDPKITQLDAPRTSKWGLMQATGNLWVWGHDGDPDQPRPSIFGGSWFDGDGAGSRYAGVAYLWPDCSIGDLGARGRSDHLELA